MPGVLCRVSEGSALHTSADVGDLPVHVLLSRKHLSTYKTNFPPAGPQKREKRCRKHSLQRQQ